MGSITGEYLSCDHTFKFPKHIRIQRESNWVTQYVASKAKNLKSTLNKLKGQDVDSSGDCNESDVGKERESKLKNIYVRETSSVSEVEKKLHDGTVVFGL